MESSEKINYPCIRKNIKRFYVVKFLDKPFEDIDEYVIVPATWIYVRHSPSQAAVTYPSYEDPIVTRSNVKKRKMCGIDWKYYVARIKYEARTYNGAESWILKRNNGQSSGEDSSLEGTQMNENPAKVEVNESNKCPAFDEEIRSNITSDSKRPKLCEQSQSVDEPSRSSLKSSDGKQSTHNSTDPQTMDCEPITYATRSSISRLRKFNSHETPRLILGAANTNRENYNDGKKPTDVVTLTDGKNLDFNNESQSDNLSVNSTPAILSVVKQSSRISLDREKLHSMPRITATKNQANEILKCSETLELIRSITAKGEISIESSANSKKSKLSNDCPSIDVSVKSNMSTSLDGYKCSEKSQSKSMQNCLACLKPVRVLPNKVSKQREYKNCFLPVTHKLHHKTQLSGAINSSHDNDNYQERQYDHFMGRASSVSYAPDQMNLSSQPTDSLKTQQPSSFNVCENPNSSESNLVSSHISTKHRQADLSMRNYPNNLVNQTLSPHKYSQQAIKKNNPIQSNFEIKPYDQNHPFQSIQTVPAQSLESLNQQSLLFCEQSQRPNDIQIQRKSLQQDINKLSNPIQSLQNAVKNLEIASRSQPNAMNQANILAPQNEKPYLTVNGNHMAQVLNYRSLEPIHVVNSNYHFDTQHFKAGTQYAAQDLSSNVTMSNQLCNFKRLHQKQNHQNNRDECRVCIQNDLHLKRKNHFQSPVDSTKKPRLSDVPYISSQVNSNLQENYNLSFIPVGSVSSYSAQFPQDQTECFTKMHASQSTLVQNSNICRVEDTSKVHVVENQPNTLNDEVEINECKKEVLESPNPTLTSNWEAKNDILSDPQKLSVKTLHINDVSVNAVKQVDCIQTNKHSGSNTMKKNMEEHNEIQENKIIQSRMVAEQQLLDLSSALFVDLAFNSSQMLDMCYQLRKSISTSNKIFNVMAKKFEILNSLDNILLQTSDDSDIINNKPTGVMDTKEIDKDDGHIKTCDDDAPIKSDEKKIYTFKKPPGYDVKNSKWTLKHKTNKSGLIELLPQSGVYVNYRALRKIKRKAPNSRMLARLLLTEIFNENALSVCSLTGTKAKAFNSIFLEIRPGLDEHARMVLLKFVEDFSAKRGWVCDTKALMSSIRAKIRQIREKWGD